MTMPDTVVSSTTNSNKSFSAENLALPDDTFRMSLDDLSLIGENVTVGDRNVSTDTVRPNDGSITTPTLETPETPMIVMDTNSPKILDTPTRHDAITLEKKQRPPISLKLTKINEQDIFVKPSPVSEVMSPAKMLQFEVDFATSATPTMKRAAIDFDFFSKSNLITEVEKDNNDKDYEETPVIVKANTVRHDIEYGK